MLGLWFQIFSLVGIADAAWEKSSTLSPLPHCGLIPNTGFMQTTSHSCVHAPKQPPLICNSLNCCLSSWWCHSGTMVRPGCLCVCDPSIAPEHFSGPNQYKQLYFLCVISGISSVQLVWQVLFHSKKNTPMMLYSVVVRCQFSQFNCDSVVVGFFSVGHSLCG